MNQNNQEINILETFINSFMVQPRFNGMNEAEKVAFRQTLIQNFNDRISSVVVLNMPQSQNEEFMKLLETNNAEEIVSFVTKHIPNIDQLVQNETSAFVNDLLATNDK